MKHQPLSHENINLLVNTNLPVSTTPVSTNLQEGKRGMHFFSHLKRLPPRFPARHIVPQSAPPCYRCSPRLPSALSLRRSMTEISDIQTDKSQ